MDNDTCIFYGYHVHACINLKIKDNTEMDKVKKNNEAYLNYHEVHLKPTDAQFDANIVKGEI